MKVHLPAPLTLARPCALLACRVAPSALAQIPDDAKRSVSEDWDKDGNGVIVGAAYAAWSGSRTTT